jgi:hypothetical protein
VAWTTPVTIVTGDVIQASWANTHVRDNSRYLKGLDGPVAISDDVSVAGDVTASEGVNAGTTGAVDGEVKALLGRFTGFPTPIGGTGVEVGVIADEGYVQAFDRTNGVHKPINIIGTEINFSIAGTEKGGVNSTGLTGDGSQITGLNASAISSGTVPDARLSSNVAFAGENISQFVNNSGYAVSGADVAATQLTGRVRVLDVSLADEASANLNTDSTGGFYLISVPGTSIFAIVYSAAGATTTLISDPNNQFSTTGTAAGKTNIGIGSGNIVLYNKTGATRAYRVTRLNGGG